MDQHLRQGFGARAFAAIRFAQGEAIAISMFDDARLDHLGGRIDDASDCLARRQEVPKLAAGIDAFDGAVAPGRVQP